MPKVAYMDNTQITNLQKLRRIFMLQDNCDGYGAIPLSKNLLLFTSRLIQKLHIQPEIFPTANGTIQIEYEKDNGDYLEFQFTGNGRCEVFRNIDNSEEYFSSPDNSYSVNALVDDFYELSF